MPQPSSHHAAPSDRADRQETDALVQTWTGREALLLRKALRVSQREFAADLGYHHGAVSSWERRGQNARLRTQTQRDLDTKLQRADHSTKQRFALALQPAMGSPFVHDAEPNPAEQPGSG